MNGETNFEISPDQAKAIAFAITNAIAEYIKNHKQNAGCFYSVKKRVMKIEIGRYFNQNIQYKKARRRIYRELPGTSGHS